MSAYLVDREHIQYLLDAAMSRRIFTCQGDSIRWSGKTLYASDYKQAEEVGQMLWDENAKSVNYRYDELEPAPAFSFKLRPAEIDPVQVIKACHCFEYQACEHPGWSESEAKNFIDALLRGATHALDGYNDAEWGAPKSCYGLSVVK